MEDFICPICGVERPDEIHLDWCTYDGPDFFDSDD
jgi:hypothetical protein